MCRIGRLGLEIYFFEAKFLESYRRLIKAVRTSQLGAVAILVSAVVIAPFGAGAAQQVPVMPERVSGGSARSHETALVSPDQLVKELERLQEAIRANGVAVTLEQVIAEGVRLNPQLEMAFTAIQDQEWALIAAQRQWYPKLQLNGSPFANYEWDTYVKNRYARSVDEEVYEDVPMAGELSRSTSRKTALTSQRFQVHPAVSASWSFIDPKRQPVINSASASLDEQKYLFSVSARSLVLDLQKAYFAIQSSEQLMDSFQQIYAINRRQLEVLEAKKGIGMVTVLDVEKTRSQLFLLLSDLISYTRNYIDQTAKLADLMALPPDTLALPSEKAAPQGGWEKPLDVTIRDALRKREEILANLAASESAQWNGVSELRSYLPVFQFVGSGSLQGVNGYSVPTSKDPGLGYETTRLWNAGAGIGFTWQVFDGGIKAANAQSSFSRSRGYMAQKFKTENQIVAEVRSSYGQMQTSKVAIASASQGYKSAQIAQEASRVRFSVGVGDITSVVQTISQLSTAAKQVSASVLAYNNSIAELYRYSATWPSGVEEHLDQRVDAIRQNSAP